VGGGRLVALVAGMLWGARNGVQFALTFVALKALPVLILGGFTSMPGAIVGGLIIGAPEKMAEVYIGPLVGGGIEGWFPYVLALLFLLVRPEGLFGEKSSAESDRNETSMLYREAGQFKTSYQADSQIFPILQDRIALLSLLVVAIVVVPLLLRLYAVGHPDPVPDLFAGGAGAEHPDRLCRPALAGHGRLHGGGRVRLVQLHRASARPAGAAGLRARRPERRLVGIAFGLPSLRIRGFYLAASTLATQFFVVWCLTKIPYLTNYSTSGVITAQPIVILGYSFDTPASKYLLVLAVVALMALLART
jgi:hypothetical protein